MLSERLLTYVVQAVTQANLRLQPPYAHDYPAPHPGQRYMLYAHVPFCERLCPYCSFNRFPYSADRATAYFANLRTEMRMLADMGYNFHTLYIGGGTPTVSLDELCATIDLAHELFDIDEVSSETNPNHLDPAVLDRLDGRIQRLSVGVQSSNNDLLRAMDRYEKYGSAEQVFERIRAAAPYFDSLNVDMIFNFPAQTEDILIDDIAFVLESGAGQATFYPLMCSPSVERKLAETLGRVDYSREQAYYETICAGMLDAGYSMSSAWAFNHYPQNMVDEYVVSAEEYPAIGSGGIAFLGNRLFVNTFSVVDYNQAIQEGRLSVMGQASFSRHNQMRYRFMMQLFGLRLDKRQFKRDFGCTPEQGLPLEMAFMTATGAFATNTVDEATLTPKGRYLMVVMMRQFFIGVNKLRDQARQALTGEERELLFGAGK